MRFLRSSLLVSLLIVSTRVGCVQPHAFFYNSFTAASFSPNCYFSPMGHAFGLGADISAGKWILSTTGLRAQLALQMAHATPEAHLHPYWYGHVDICFDIISAIKGRNPSNMLRSYVLIGVGIVHSSEGDNDFCGVIGAGVDYRISSNWRLFTELQSLIHPSDFDDNSRSSMISSLRIGVLRDIAYNPTRSRSPLESRALSNDWFFNIAFGSNLFRYKYFEGEGRNYLMPIFEFAIGKRLNNVWQIRTAASGLYARSYLERFSYYHLHGDLMLDIAALVGKGSSQVARIEQTNSFFTSRPYVSAGIVTRLDDASHFLFSPSGGIQFVLRFVKNHEVYADIRYVVTPPRFANIEVPQGTFSVGIASLLFGYSYTFSKSSF